MGARGPAPKPLRLKMLNGSAEHHPERIPKHPAQPLDRAPAMPTDMAPADQAVWRDTLAAQAPGVILAAHGPVLRIFCEAVVRYQAAVALLGTGLVGRGTRGQELVRHPLLGIVRGEADLIRLYARELGLTPSAVATLSG